VAGLTLRARLGLGTHITPLSPPGSGGDNYGRDIAPERGHRCSAQGKEEKWSKEVGREGERTN